MLAAENEGGEVCRNVRQRQQIRRGMDTEHGLQELAPGVDSQTDIRIRGVQLFTELFIGTTNGVLDVSRPRHERHITYRDHVALEHQTGSKRTVPLACPILSHQAE